MGWFLERLSKKELLKLVKAYSDYVMDFPETHEEGNYPCCLAEFFDNEYQELEEDK